ncbi:MAG: PorV/PorQ family protein [Endomicrobiales bacterium]
MGKFRRLSMWIITCSLGCLLAYSPSFAAAGKTGGQFLKISPSARAAGMGGAFAGLADDVFALSLNPAGLAQLQKAELTTTFLRYFEDVSFGFIGYASRVRDVGVFGFGYTYLLVDNIEKRDVNEAQLGQFNAKDTSLTLSFARGDVAPDVLENLSVGASLKVISAEIDQTIAYTGALDLAGMYHPTKSLSFALAVENISPGIRFKEVTDQLPLNLKAGASYHPSGRWNVGAEIDEYFIDNQFYAALGGEYWLVEQLALRAGYRFGYHTASLGSTVGLGVGIGFRIWSVGLDYAFVPFGDLGDTHRVSFVAKF